MYTLNGPRVIYIIAYDTWPAIHGSEPTSQGCHSWFEPMGEALAAGDHHLTLYWPRWVDGSCRLWPHTSPIRPAAYIAPVYCVHICETVTFTAIWSVTDSVCHKEAYVQILMGNTEQTVS